MSMIININDFEYYQSKYMQGITILNTVKQSTNTNTLYSQMFH